MIAYRFLISVSGKEFYLSQMDPVSHNPSVVNYTLEKTFARKSVRSRIKSLTLCIVEFACKQDLGICPMVRKI